MVWPVLVGAEHWAFVPPRKSPPPEVRDLRWVRNGIDRFVLGRLESEGIAPSPEASPFVEVGQRVEAGQIVCIIEAMKILNQIEAEVSGVVIEVLLENGQPVEFDQTIMLIE